MTELIKSVRFPWSAPSSWQYYYHDFHNIGAARLILRDHRYDRILLLPIQQMFVSPFELPQATSSWSDRQVHYLCCFLSNSSIFHGCFCPICHGPSISFLRHHVSSQCYVGFYNHGNMQVTIIRT